jgi:uncharacterized membrane protein
MPVEPSHSSPAPHPKPARVEFIDLLRGWAVIIMIETHVVNATLREELMAGGLFQYLKFLNGLVAPSFLFAAGMAFAVTTRRKLNDYLTFGPPLFKQLWRLLFILIVGYILHLPKFSFSMLVHETTPDEWLVFFQADVLHCIAVSLLAMQGLLLLLRSERRLYVTAALLALLLTMSTPLMWTPGVTDGLPAPLAAYVNGLQHSLFPVFPWTAFVFAGAVAGYLYVQATNDHRREGSRGGASHIMIRIAAAGIVTIVISMLIEPFAASAYDTYDYWLFSPSFVLLRIGIVMILCAGMFLFERQRGVSASSVVTLIGRESLIVYVTHLLLLYGDFGPFNFERYVGRSFGYGEAALVTVVLWLLMYVLARFWGNIKRGDPKIKRAIQLAALAVFLGVFFFGPGQ